MPKDHDFKRLVRARMAGTGERYTTARAVLAAQRDPGQGIVSDRAHSLLGQLADVGLALAARGHLEKLPEPERRAAAIEGLRHQDWRVRRTCAYLLDPVDLTPESVAALTRALDDEHPQVRRKAVHSLGCENCKPNGCAVDVRPLFEHAIGDDSVLVRSMVIHVVTLHFSHHQWAVDLVARVAASDKTPGRGSGRPAGSSGFAGTGTPTTAAASCRPTSSPGPNGTPGTGSWCATDGSSPTAMTQRPAAGS